MLVLYYSQTGNTKVVAQEIANKLGVDIEEITMIAPYDPDFQATIDRCKKDQEQGVLPEIQPVKADIANYDSNELIEKAVNAINAELMVTELKYVMTIGDQKSVDTFGDTKTTTQKLGTVSTSSVKYDLVGEVAKRTTLTRRTTATILNKIRPGKLAMFRNNPEEFIKNVSRIIRNEKATMIVEHIQYDRIDQTYDSEIFTQEKHSQNVSKSYSSKKHIFFIAETKGSMDSMQLKKVEEAKIGCAEKLFNNLSTSHVSYHKVDSYQTMLDIMKGMD